MEHEIKNKLFINGSIENSKDSHGICDELLEMNVTKGDMIRLEPFTENKGDYAESYHGIEFSVIKVLKVVKKTWNSSFYNAVEIHLEKLE